MSLDVSLMVEKPTEVFDANITHNLAEMARRLGVGVLWEVDRIEVSKVRPLAHAAIDKILARPTTFRALDAENGWGRTEHMVHFLHRLVRACDQYPDGFLEMRR